MHQCPLKDKKIKKDMEYIKPGSFKDSKMEMDCRDCVFNFKGIFEEFAEIKDSSSIKEEIKKLKEELEENDNPGTPDFYREIDGETVYCGPGDPNMYMDARIYTHQHLVSEIAKKRNELADMLNKEKRIMENQKKIEEEK